MSRRRLAQLWSDLMTNKKVTADCFWGFRCDFVASRDMQVFFAVWIVQVRFLCEDIPILLRKIFLPCIRPISLPGFTRIGAVSRNFQNIEGVSKYKSRKSDNSVNKHTCLACQQFSKSCIRSFPLIKYDESFTHIIHINGKLRVHDF